MWIYPEEMSEIAYKICLEEDTLEMRSLITTSQWAYYYCQNIKDRSEMRDRITESYWAYAYCKYIKDIPEMRDRVTGSQWAYWL